MHNRKAAKDIIQNVIKLQKELNKKY
jgi:hypothetical protein